MILFLAVAAGILAAGFCFWRYYWFFRDPPRTAPTEAGLLSPADGTVVYVKHVPAGSPVIVIKKGVAATVKDIAREDDGGAKIVIGIFMSPLDVHFNRAPLAARVDFIHRYPATGGSNLAMGAMHWRTLLGREPYYAGSMHIVQNERAVTRFEGEYKGTPLAAYVVQIGSFAVRGIDSYIEPGKRVERGATFGMIRVGSQVDLIVPWREDLEPTVRPGDRVTGGETIVVR